MFLFLQGEKLSIDNELDEIREAMTKERANALQEQEVKIAAMLADLQMAKAKEVTDPKDPSYLNYKGSNAILMCVENC